MPAAALEFGRELCTCSPDVLGSLQNISSHAVKGKMSYSEIAKCKGKREGGTAEGTEYAEKSTGF